MGRWILAPDSSGACCDCLPATGEAPNIVLPDVCAGCFPRCGHPEDEIGTTRPHGIVGDAEDPDVDVWFTSWDTDYCRWWGLPVTGGGYAFLEHDDTDRRWIYTRLNNVIQIPVSEVCSSETSTCNPVCALDSITTHRARGSYTEGGCGLGDPIQIGCGRTYASLPDPTPCVWDESCVPAGDVYCYDYTVYTYVSGTTNINQEQWVRGRTAQDPDETVDKLTPDGSYTGAVIADYTDCCGNPFAIFTAQDITVTLEVPPP